MKDVFIGMILFLLFITETSAQKVIASAGGSGTSSGGVKMSWTMGEAFIGTEKSSSGSSMVFGFQQPSTTKAKDPVTSVTQEKLVTVTVMPNPVVKNVQVTFLGEPAKGTTFMLVDSQGRFILQQTAFESQSLDMSSLSPGIYYLLICNGGKKQQTIKLIKAG